MPTTSDYLTQLQADKQAIVDNLEERGITVSSGATFTDLVPLVESIPSGGGSEQGFLEAQYLGAGTSARPYIMDMITSVKVNGFQSNFNGSLQYAFARCKGLKYAPVLTFATGVDQTLITNTSYMFYLCEALEDGPLFDTSNVTNMSSMFYQCTRITNVPVYNTSKVTNFVNMFGGNPAIGTYMTTQSVDNILQMCIGATSYNDTKTLTTLGFNSSKISASKIQGCTHYQDFLDAGWTIGY